MADFLDEGANRIENGETEIGVNVLGLFGYSGKLNLLDVLLELPVIDEGVFPFWDELSFELLGELHHFYGRRMKKWRGREGEEIGYMRRPPGLYTQRLVNTEPGMGGTETRHHSFVSDFDLLTYFLLF